MNKNATKTTLVIGASENTARYSNMALKLLKLFGHPTLAFGKQSGEVEGQRIETQLNTFIGQEIDTVTMYLNPQNQTKYYQDIIQLKPKRVIFNPGTENDEFVELLHQNNIETEEACTLILLKSGQY